MDVEPLLESIKRVLHKLRESEDIILDMSAFVKVYVKVPTSEEMTEYIGKLAVSEMHSQPSAVFDIRIVESVDELRMVDRILGEFKEKIANTPSIFNWRLDQTLFLNMHIEGGGRIICMVHLNTNPVIVATNASDMKTLDKLREIFGMDVEFLLI